MRYFVTRNRRDRPFTTEMDEIVDSKPTGKIVVCSKIIDGKYIPIYKGEEPFEPDLKKFNLWFQKQFSNKLSIENYNQKIEEKGTFAEAISKPEGEEYSVFMLEFDWHYGHEKEECESKKSALQRKEEWISTFYWAEFSNWKLYSEARFRIDVTDKI